MGSSKKGNKRAGRGDQEQGPHSSDSQARDEALLQALHLQQAAIERAIVLVQEVAESRQTVERQLERLLTLQQRTNALLELSLGSAFDLELGGPGNAR
jgi:transcriptional regulator GlxA family with amidase domain